MFFKTFVMEEFWLKYPTLMEEFKNPQIQFKYLTNYLQKANDEIDDLNSLTNNANDSV
jgi:hypothetical protein